MPRRFYTVTGNGLVVVGRRKTLSFAGSRSATCIHAENIGDSRTCVKLGVDSVRLRHLDLGFYLVGLDDAADLYRLLDGEGAEF